MKSFSHKIFSIRRAFAFFATISTAFAVTTFGAETNSIPVQAEPFYGEHQSGVATSRQLNMYFAAFDLITTNRDDVVKLLKAWTAAAARMTQGETAQPLENGFRPAVPPATNAVNGGDYETPDPSTMAADTGEAIGLPPARLTVTFGFGAGLFVKDGKDRFGLAARRPEAFVDMPKFANDQMIEGRTDGDLAVEACADDPQVAFHAIRQLARIGEGVVQIRWVQTGYWPTEHRHLLGFPAEAMGVSPDDAQAMNDSVWVGSDGPEWMRGGTYQVVRRIRFALEHWDHMPVAYQEKAIGEMKHPHSEDDANTNAPATDADGEDIPSHLRIVGPRADTMLRRSFSYNDGVSVITERWPPWRQALEYDAGMFFICYQNDPREGFIGLYDKMSKYDVMLNQFWTHTGSGLFAIPPGAKKGEYIGQHLFEPSSQP